MEEIKEAYERLITSNEFCTGEKGEDAFLASFSVMAEFNKLDTAHWQIDFFSPNSGRLTSFVMKNEISISPDQTTLGGGSKQLNMGIITVGFNDAMEKATHSLREKLNETAQSVIAVLQCRTFPMWIITFVTPSMKVASVEINAQTGEVTSEKAGSFVR